MLFRSLDQSRAEVSSDAPAALARPGPSAPCRWAQLIAAHKAKRVGSTMHSVKITNATCQVVCAVQKNSYRGYMGINTRKQKEKQKLETSLRKSDTCNSHMNESLMLNNIFSQLHPLL